PLAKVTKRSFEQSVPKRSLGTRGTRGTEFGNERMVVAVAGVFGGIFFCPSASIGDSNNGITSSVITSQSTNANPSACDHWKRSSSQTQTNQTTRWAALSSRLPNSAPFRETVT